MKVENRENEEVKVERIEAEVATAKALLEIKELLTSLTPVLSNFKPLLEEVRDLLKAQQEQFKRDNPVEKDEPIFEWASAALEPGYKVIFYYDVPSGYKLYLKRIGITFWPDFKYQIFLDGRWSEETSDVLQDFSDQVDLWKPAKILNSQIAIHATNSSSFGRTVDCYMVGFLRAIKK